MFSRETLKQLHYHTKQVKDSKELASELLRTAQDRGNTIEHELEREGKTIKLTEKVLWEEVFLLGVKSQSGKILEPKYPKVFEAYKKQNTAAAELKVFTLAELGIDYTQLSLDDYMSLTESLVHLMLEERGIMGASKNGRVRNWLDKIVKK